MQDISKLTLKRIGILISFNQYKARNGRYPETPEELNEVTTSLLHQKKFKEQKRWFHEFTGEPV